MSLFKYIKRQDNPHFAAYYRWLILTRHLGIQVGADSILDVGCGDGHILSHQVGRLRVGLDLQPNVTSVNDLSIVQADGSVLPFADKSFSVILAFDIIEHILDYNAFINSITRVLGPEGHLWISSPTDTAYLFPAWLTKRAMKGWGHQRIGYDPDDLVRRFPSGFRVLQVVLWNATSFRHLYVPLRVLRVLSASLSRLFAYLCFEIDRRLPNGRDHIFLQVARETTSGKSTH